MAMQSKAVENVKNNSGTSVDISRSVTCDKSHSSNAWLLLLLLVSNHSDAIQQCDRDVVVLERYTMQTITRQYLNRKLMVMLTNRPAQLPTAQLPTVTRNTVHI